jgi:DNA polymerase-3 subunit gamma/tau
VSYLVLARKYRPQSFQDLVGQEHVAQTLANAIAQGRVAHAFLFTGVRGVGKTTSARLLAKCLNCLGADGQAKGPTATPCQVCAACTEIAAGVDMDVQEIDGASYNGVDEVRRLQEGLSYRPARDRFKIYIVDEVHMLSNAAWNAFLKTLEEPPPHVKFIFATTEVHKLPVTILSRVQRYDFKLISTQRIAKRLEEVLTNEKITFDGEAISVIAREAAGSMRDAMSLLDQVIAFSGEKLSGADVTKVLGVADRKVLHDLASALVFGDAAAALQITGSLAQQGFDLPHVARDVLRHLRNLVVAKVSGEAGRSLLDLADEEAKDVFDLAAKADADDVTRLFSGFSRGFDDVVKSSQPRMAIEMLLVRLARRPPLLPVEDLVARLSDLEKRLGGAPPSPPRGNAPSSGGGRAPDRNDTRSFSGTQTQQAAPIASRPLAPPQPPPQISAPQPMPTPQARANPAPQARNETSTMGALALAPEIMPSVMPVRAADPAIESRRHPAPREVEIPAAPPPPATPKTIFDEWRTILARLRATRPDLEAVFAHAVPLEMNKDRVKLGYGKDEFLAYPASDSEDFELLTRAVRAHFNAPTEVSLDLANRPPTGVTLASVDAKAEKDRIAQAKADVARHPLIAEALDIFSGELREVRLPDPRED